MCWALFFFFLEEGSLEVRCSCCRSLFPLIVFQQSTLQNQQVLLEQNCNCNWFPSRQVVTVLFLAAICYNRKHVRPFRCATWIYIYINISFFKGWSLYPTDHAIEIQRILDPTGSDYGFISCTETAQAYGRDVHLGRFEGFPCLFRWIDWIKFEIMEFCKLKVRSYNVMYEDVLQPFFCMSFLFGLWSQPFDAEGCCVLFDPAAKDSVIRWLCPGHYPLTRVQYETRQVVPYVA